LEPEVAKKLAAGDLHPADLTPMKDINPNYKPQPLNRDKKRLASTSNVPAKPKPTSGGILSFFGAFGILRHPPRV